MSKAILVIDMPNLESHEIDSYDMVADLKVKSLLLGGERYDFELKNVVIKPMGLRTQTDGYVLYSTEYLKKHFETEYKLWKELGEEE